MKKILLQVCCAPCACFPMQVLFDEGFKITLFFYNPNIHPEKEYEKRLTELKKYVAKFPAVNLVAGKYEKEKWLAQTKSLAQELEGGKRCDVCYRIRLKKTAQTAKQKNFNYYGSTLSISPHKKAAKISELGNKLAKEIGIAFLDRNWRKKEGFKKACLIAKVEKFYRQNYCGCIYSQLT